MLGKQEIVQAVGLTSVDELQFMAGREHFDVYYHKPTEKSYFVFDKKENADCMVLLDSILEVDIASLLKRALVNKLIDANKVFKQDFIDTIEEEWTSVEDFIENSNEVIPVSKLNTDYLLSSNVCLCKDFQNGLEVANGYIVTI